jgi:hypothetical protein
MRIDVQHIVITTNRGHSTASNRTDNPNRKLCFPTPGES